MHAKSLVFDGNVAFNGSVNLTHNGMENSKEHLFRITCAAAIEDVLEDFEKIGRSQKECEACCKSGALSLLLLYVLRSATVP